jgi:hypothetical protein
MTEDPDAKMRDPRMAEFPDQNATIAGTHVIVYGDLTVLAPLRDIHIALGNMRSMMAAERRLVAASVNAALAKSLRRVKAHAASEKQAMAFMQDIVIWYANEIIEARARESGSADNPAQSSTTWPDRTK